MAKDKLNVRDPKYFDAKNLVKWLKKHFKEKGFDFKLLKAGKEMSLDEFEKNEKDKGSLSKFSVKIKGNPYKLKQYLPDGWDFNGKEIVNRNKNEPDYFKVEAFSKDAPVPNIEDPLDLAWAIQVKNPSVRLLRRDNATNMEFDGKSPEDLILPSGFEFDKEHGVLTNNGNVLSGTRPLSIFVSKSSGDVNISRNEMGDVRGDSLDKFENAGTTPGRDLSGATPVGAFRYAWQGVMNNMSPEDIAHSIATNDFSDAFFNYKKYSLVTDAYNQPALQFQGEGADAGQLIYDDELMRQVALIDSLINSNFAMSDNMQNQLDISNKDLTSAEMEKLKEIYDQFQEQNEEHKKEGENEIVPDEVTSDEALKDTVEEVFDGKATEEPAVSSSGVSAKLEENGINVQEASSSDIAFTQVFNLAQAYIIDESAEIPAVRDALSGEMIEGENKNKVLFFKAMATEVVGDKDLRELTQEDIERIKPRYLQILNSPESGEIVRKTIQNYMEYVKSMDMSRERKYEGDSSTDNN